MPYAYPSELFLAGDGQHLVRVQGRVKDDADTVIVLYKQGRVLRAYICADLVKDKDGAGRTSEGYRIIAGGPGFVDRDGRLRFRVGIVGGSEFVFDCDTGDIVAAVKIRAPG
jgi:hypothetical protein